MELVSERLSYQRLTYQVGLMMTRASKNLVSCQSLILVISSEGPATWDSILQPACEAEWRLIGLCNHPGFSMLVNPDLASQVVGGDFEERNLPVESLVNVVGIGPTWIPGVQHIVIQNS